MLYDQAYLINNKFNKNHSKLKEYRLHYYIMIAILILGKKKIKVMEFFLKNSIIIFVMINYYY